MVDMFKILDKRIESAKKDLKSLNDLIAVAEEAGEDITEMAVKRDELEEKIGLWDTAIKKRLKK